MRDIPRIVNKIIDSNAIDSVHVSQDDIVLPKSKEYSLEQFKKDYVSVLHSEVFPKLEQLEQLRLQYKKKADDLGKGVIIMIIIYIVVSMLFLVIPHILFILGLFFVLYSVRLSIKKKFEYELKKQVMPVLMQAIPGFSWTPNQLITKSEPEFAGLYTDDIEGAYNTDDNFEGTYRGVGITITECCCLDKNKIKIFQGPIIRIKMNKNFEGVTIIRHNDYITRFNKLEEIKLEDIVFSQKFKVFSTDQIEARYLLTTAFMDRFKAIMVAFDTERIHCSFFEDNVYIAPYTTKDLFNLGDLSKTLLDEEQYEVLFNEFASILALVDHFKLDKKLGL